MAASVLRSPPHYSSFSEDSPTPAKRFALGVTTKAVQPRHSTSTESVTDTATDGREVDGGSERHYLYDLALRIYSAAKNGKVPDGVRFPDTATKHQVYQLVFDVIHHAPAIEELLIESGFYSKNFDLHGHESLVLIVTYDYQNRKFGLKPLKNGAENVPHLVLKVREAVLRHRVKLSAALARMRVKSNAQSTTQLLPEASYLKYQEVVTQPFYTRVNRNKVHKIQADVLSPLQEDGLTACCSREMLIHSKRTFCHLQRNLVAFSSDLRGGILQHGLLTKGYLVPQDCASYFLIESLRDLFSQCNGDVVVTHCNAGTEVAHIASLVRDGAKVIAYGVLPMQMEALTTYLHRQDISNVHCVHAPFTHADPLTEELSNVSVVVCLPPSSLSTVVQPLDILHQEGDHLLPLLFCPEKEALTRTLPQEQTFTLAHAFTFSQSQYVVYAVRSREDRETTAVVAAALKRHQAALKAGEEGKEETAVQREFILSSSAPVSNDETDQYCMTLLERKPEEPGPSPADVIAKAVASGVLSGEGIGLQKQIKTKRKKKVPRIFSQHKGIPMTISAQKKVVSKKLLPQDLNTRRPFR